MRSVAWDGDRAVEQPFGCTALSVEPYWAARGCHWHCGIDIAFATGEPIYAARAGHVLAVGTGFLIIQVGAEADWYLHGSRYVVSRGQDVARGQLVGYAGDVAPPGGASFGSHLHFERQSTLALYCNIPATSLDPVPVLISGGGDDMLPDERSTLMAEYAITSGARLNGKAVDQALFDLGGSNARIEAAMKVLLAQDSAEAATAMTELKALEGQLTQQFSDMKAVLASNAAQSLSDLKAALNSLKVIGGGLTPDQDAALQAAEKAAATVEAQLLAGLKVDLPVAGIDLKGTVKP